MMQKIRAHLGYYVVFIFIAILGFFLLAASVQDQETKMAVVIMLALSYMVWGLLHHYIHHDISTKIVLEYVLVGTLGISVIFFLLK